ncbi:unnamed protein product [Microthlaspi erraticum]|uniref:Uncharacterized protein n=1 Tax=Microthlaspi erraticum TaxID=1685480 RepID=A0A6D2KKR5_9BRAS|nr:unnamed protein product [Microthlaspi erraticum]
MKQDLQDTPRIEYLQAYIGAVLKSISDPHRKRSPKLSAHWYSAFLKGNTLSWFPRHRPIAQNFSSSS